MSNWGLSPLSSGFFTNSTNYTSGPVSNEFAAAAFRMGHSMVQGTVSLYDASNTQTNYTMTDYFNDASVVYNNKTFLDSVIRGLITQNSLAVDRFITTPLWLALFAYYLMIIILHYLHYFKVSFNTIGELVEKLGLISLP